MNRHTLSKSTFLRGLQCHKSLYLNKYHPDFRNEITPEQQQIFSQGKEVGKIARGLFPGGIEVITGDQPNINESLDLTQKSIKDGVNVIYEAAFQYDEVLIFADIIVKENDKWKIYEVKSSTDLKEVYIFDTAIQYYVVSNSGISLSDIFVLYINNNYVRIGDLDVRQLFSNRSVMPQVLHELDSVKENIQIFKDVLNLKGIPNIDIGEYCHNPYECDFTGYCWRHIPDNSVFDLKRLNSGKKFELYKQGIIGLGDIPEDYPLNKRQRLQVETYKQKRDFIDRESIRDFLNTLHYPLYFMDFETFNPAIPPFNNTRPYQKVPFQFSLHLKEDENSSLRHFEFLGEAGKDPRKEFIVSLLGNIRENGDIIVYSKPFEEGILKELVRDLPEYQEEINKILPRIRDLMLPFQKAYYYKPVMSGSYSIKAVLPALVTDLNYGNLKISNGSQAMYAYEQLQHESNVKRISEIRRSLLEYCRLDTLGMVRILEVLEKL